MGADVRASIVDRARAFCLTVLVCMQVILAVFCRCALARTFENEPRYPFWDEAQDLGRPWLRLGGDTRYETSARVAEETFASSRTAVLVSGATFADALSASAVAGTLGAPVVLTEPGRLSEAARSTLAGLGVREVTIVGGEAAVAPAVASAVTSRGMRVSRIAGADRASTSVACLEVAQAKAGASDTVFVASGEGYADALSAGPYAWAEGAPILLCGADHALGEGALQAIGSRDAIRHVVILGGEAAVSPLVEEQLKGLGHALEVERIGGVDRYETSAEVALWECARGFSWACPLVASGKGFADALAGSALAGSYRSPLLLADGADGPHTRVLAQTRSSFVGGTLLGGVRALPWDTVTDVARPDAVSPLVSVVILSPNHSGTKQDSISCITPHYMDEQWSALTCGRSFANPAREASSNYGIGLDGEVALYVEEKDRSWASSSSDNDDRAITIECANLPDSSLTPATWESLVSLCADICVRNDMGHIDYTGTPDGDLTMHMWFAKNPVTECPGPWLSSRFSELADAVNAVTGL